MTDWIERWKTSQIGWHQNAVNKRLIKFINCLKLSKGDVVFVPLCGKSLDMIYLTKQGFKVIGVEISELAVKQFFDEHQLPYSRTKITNFQLYKSKNITIYCGDYFALTAAILRTICAVYDRAALIALPAFTRAKYAQHLTAIIPPDCRMLLLTLNYPQSQMSGPPYALAQKELVSLYQKRFKYQQLQCFNDIKNEPKFQNAGVDFIEKATYCLQKRSINNDKN